MTSRQEKLIENYIRLKVKKLMKEDEGRRKERTDILYSNQKIILSHLQTITDGCHRLMNDIGNHELTKKEVQDKFKSINNAMDQINNLSK